MSYWEAIEGTWNQTRTCSLVLESTHRYWLQWQILSISFEISSTGVLLQPLVPPSNSKIQHRWVRVVFVGSQNQMLLHRRFFFAKLAMVCYNVNQSAVWGELDCQCSVPGKKLVLKALTPFQTGQEVSWSSNHFLFSCLASTPTPILREVKIIWHFLHCSAFHQVPLPCFRWVKTTARFSTSNPNRTDKENWKPGRQQLL